MADELIKVELELPKSQVHIEPLKTETPTALKDDSEREKLEKTRQIMDEESPKRRLQKLRNELLASRRAKDDDRVKSNPSAALLKPLEMLPAGHDTRPPNRHQKIVIGAGLIIAIVGLLLWPLAGSLAAVLVTASGATLVATGTFVRV